MINPIIFFRNNRIKIIYHIMLIIIFTLIYYNLHHYLSKLNNEIPKYTWHDYLYFTSITQTTIGYEDNVINKFPIMKSVAIIQCILIIIITGI